MIDSIQNSQPNVNQEHHVSSADAYDKISEQLSDIQFLMLIDQIKFVARYSSCAECVGFITHELIQNSDENDLHTAMQEARKVIRSIMEFLKQKGVSFNDIDLNLFMKIMFRNEKGLKSDEGKNGKIGANGKKTGKATKGKGGSCHCKSHCSNKGSSDLSLALINGGAVSVFSCALITGLLKVLNQSNIMKLEQKLEQFMAENRKKNRAFDKQDPLSKLKRLIESEIKLIKKLRKESGVCDNDSLNKHHCNKKHHHKHLMPLLDRASTDLCSSKAIKRNVTAKG